VQQLAHLNREYIERLEDMTFARFPQGWQSSSCTKPPMPIRFQKRRHDSPRRRSPRFWGRLASRWRALRGLLNTGLLRKEGRKVYIADRTGLEILAETNTMPRTSGNLNADPEYFVRVALYSSSDRVMGLYGI